MAREQRNDSDGTELGRFLRAHRTRVTSEAASLPSGHGLRRTPGLRREEPAALAGVSIDYCTHIERGKESRPSPSIIDAPARVLLLDEREHAHLRDLTVCAARTTAAALAECAHFVSRARNRVPVGKPAAQPRGRGEPHDGPARVEPGRAMVLLDMLGQEQVAKGAQTHDDPFVAVEDQTAPPPTSTRSSTST